MNANLVDALYEGFLNSLPRSVQPTARDLPFELKLAPERGIGWGSVFSHEVTLAAPTLIAEAFPELPLAVTRSAVLSHCLAVIEAFGSDRVSDAQVEVTPELALVLEHLRAARDKALEEVEPGATASARAADARTRAAIQEEASLLRGIAPVSFSEYFRISLGKQAVGFPASLALGRAATQNQARLQHIERLLEGVWLGLQFEDDVVDWEDDWRRGGAWAVCLAHGLRNEERSDGRITEPDLVRRAVLCSGVLRNMLERARRQYRIAWRHADALGAFRLGQWARAREQRLLQLIPLEEKHAGYAVRLSKLGTWALEVLA